MKFDWLHDVFFIKVVVFCCHSDEKISAFSFINALVLVFRNYKNKVFSNVPDFQNRIMHGLNFDILV